MHALQEKRHAVKSLWVGSRAVLLRALTLDLVLQIFAVTVQRWPTTFPSEDIPTTLYRLCCHGQSLLTTWTHWSVCGMKTACCTHRCSHQYLPVPTGKAKSRHHRTTTVNHKNQHRPDPCSQPNSYECLFTSATSEPSCRYDGGQEVFAEDNAL